MDNVLPKLAEEVHAAYKSTAILAPPTEAPRKKETKIKQNTSKCKECDFDRKNVNGLNAHMKLVHKKGNKVQTKKSKLTLDNLDTISLEEFAEKFNLEDGDERSIQEEQNIVVSEDHSSPHEVADDKLCVGSICKEENEKQATVVLKVDGKEELENTKLKDAKQKKRVSKIKNTE